MKPTKQEYDSWIELAEKRVGASSKYLSKETKDWIVDRLIYINSANYIANKKEIR